jgi:hypothetical protein
MRRWLALVVLVVSCKQSAEMEQVAKETLRAVRTKEVLKVQVRLDKPEPPAAVDLEIRKQIEDRIEQDNVGTLTESTTDAGHYDLTIEVESTNDAIPQLRAILRDAGVVERTSIRVETKK